MDQLGMIPLLAGGAVDNEVRPGELQSSIGNVSPQDLLDYRTDFLADAPPKGRNLYGPLLRHGL